MISLGNRRRRRFSWYLIWSAIFFSFLAVALSLVLSLPVWRIGQVRVFGANIVSEKHVEKMAEPLLEENIFLVDYSELKNNINQIRQIKDFGIWRSLPATLVIKLVERRPFAVAIISGSSVVIDEDGVVLSVSGGSKFKGDYSFIKVGDISSLPAVRGIGIDKVADGRLKEDVAEAIKVSINKLSQFLRGAKLQLEIIPGGDMNLLVEDVLKVRFGDIEDISRKITVLQALLPQIDGRWGDVSYIDIRIASSPAIKFSKM
jgi:cell division septal protein FtsQ